MCKKKRWKCLSVTQIQSTVERTREGANNKATPQNVARQQHHHLTWRRHEWIKRHLKTNLSAIGCMQSWNYNRRTNATQLSFRQTRLNLVSIVWLTIFSTRHPVSRRHFPKVRRKTLSFVDIVPRLARHTMLR